MKRLIAGAGLAAAIVTGAHSPEAAAQTPDICAPVYDETLTGDQSQVLAQQIESYAERGIAVHVQLLADGRDDGISEATDIQAFAEDLVEECRWGADVISVTVSAEPRKYGIWRTGKADDVISQSAVDQAESGFVRALQDESQGYQYDVANLLRDINPATPASPTSEQNTETDDDEPFEMPSIPFAKIGIGALVLTAAGSSFARIRRGVGLRRLKNTAVSDTNKTIDTIINSQGKAIELLNIIPPDDAQESRHEEWALGMAISGLSTDRSELEQTYEEERWRLWPSIGRVEDSARTLRSKTEGATVASAKLNEEIGTLQDRIAHIDKTLARFGEMIGDFEDAIQTLEAAEWDATSLRTRLTEYQAKQEEILALRRDQYVDRPADMVDEIDDSVAADTDIAQQIPKHYDNALKLQREQQDEIDQQVHEMQKARRSLQAMRGTYHPSCHEDLGAQEPKFGELYSQVVARGKAVAELLGSKSTADLVAAEEAQRDIIRLTDNIDELIYQIGERAQQLADLDRDLPGIYETLLDNTVNDIEAANSPDTTFTDMEPGTIEAIRGMERKVRDASAGLGEEKPRLLELQATAKKLDQERDALRKQGRAEVQEMQDLRANAREYHTRIGEQLRELQRYGGNSDVTGTTRARIGSVSNIEPRIALSRQGLRDQVADYQALQAAIVQLQEEAKSDIVDAEEERRRERQRRDDEERRRRNSSSFDNGSFGAGLGMGSSFGGFDGGSSSGGGSSFDGGSF